MQIQQIAWPQARARLEERLLYIRGLMGRSVVYVLIWVGCAAAVERDGHKWVSLLLLTFAGSSFAQIVHTSILKLELEDLIRRFDKKHQEGSL